MAAYPRVTEKQWWTLRKRFRGQFPTRVTVDYLATSLKISREEAENIVLPDLVTIKFIDKDGAPTARAREWLDNLKYRAVCNRLLKEIYPADFNEGVKRFWGPAKKDVQSWFQTRVDDRATALDMASFYLLLYSSDAYSEPRAPGTGIINDLLMLYDAGRVLSRHSTSDVLDSEHSSDNTQEIILHSPARGAPPYIEIVIQQINVCYAGRAYDGCAVLIRRLVEMLIVESFEAHGIAERIKNTRGDFVGLKDLIERATAEPTWTIGKKTKEYLWKLKDLGDLSAHNRRYNANESDIKAIIPELRVVIEELVYLSKSD